MKAIAVREAPVNWFRKSQPVLGSLFLHLAVVLLVSVWLRGCRTAASSDSGGEVYHEIGLIATNGVENGAAEAGTTAGEGPDEKSHAGDPAAASDSSDASQPGNSSSRSPLVPGEAPDIASLLENDGGNADRAGDQSLAPAILGPGFTIGSRAAAGAASGSNELIQPAEAGGAAKVGGTGGIGDTTFMDVQSVGESFVYVIDTSSSMHGSRLKIAQSQLKASLRLLQPSQKFAVILYNEVCTRMTLGRLPEQDMYFATDRNKQLAVEEINRLTSSAGTDHMPALLEALRLRPDLRNRGSRPDVVYFLTDGDEPSLSPAQLREISRAAGKATIHVIQFGDGLISSREVSWLERLARQSGGEFRLISSGK